MAISKSRLVSWQFCYSSKGTNFSSNYLIKKTKTKTKKTPKSKIHFSKPNWAMDPWLEQSL